MKAYIAIIRDCFHEAFVSRVLWIILGLITLLLALLVPLSITERPAIQIRPVEVTNPIRFLTQVSEAGSSSTPSPGGAIWALLDDSEQTSVNELLSEQEENNSNRGIRQALAIVLDAVQESDEPSELYSGGAFEGITISEEAETLIARGAGDLSLDEERRLNRLLAGAAFPNAIYLRDEPESRVTYLGRSGGLDPIPVRKDEIVKSGITGLTAFLVGTLGVMLAILVTASMIPQTFEKGAVDLLLSKPINRSLLFLSKYVGGCAFVLINTTYLIGGIFLLAGIRYDFWQPRMLLSIPIFLFLFAIYYSISAIAGMIWRNAVVSVVLTVVFWAACAVVGVTRNVIQEAVLMPGQFTQLVPTGAGLLAANEAQRLLQWDDSEQSWSTLEDLSDGSSMPAQITRLDGPVYDADDDRVVALRSRGGTGLMGGGRRFSGGDAGSSIIGGAESNWALEDGPPIDDRPVGIYTDTSGGITVAGYRAMYRLKSDSEGAETFEAIGPNVRLAPPTSVSFDPPTRRIAVWDGSRLAVYGVDASDRYEMIRQREIESLDTGLVSFRGDVIAIASEDGGLGRFSATDLSDTSMLKSSTDSLPRFIRASADGSWTAVVFHDGTLRVAGPTDSAWSKPRIAEQGNVSAAAFAEDGQLWVAGKYQQVSAYTPGPFEAAERYWPALEPIEKFARYAVEPLYTVFPKPGELDSVISYLMTEEESVALDKDDLGIRRVAIPIWGPIWSNLAFLTVVLALACMYLHRKDF